MVRADIDNTTSRRGFLTRGVATVAGGAVLLATPAVAKPSSNGLDGLQASPALRDAVTKIYDADENLTAAKARFVANDAKVAEWRISNPQPIGGRARKRWSRKWREYQDATAGESWAAQLEAEKQFQKAQMAVAKVKPRDSDDLALKAAVASVYDKVHRALSAPSRSYRTRSRWIF
jgi:hypothetical protein